MEIVLTEISQTPQKANVTYSLLFVVVSLESLGICVSFRIPTEVRELGMVHVEGGLQGWGIKGHEGVSGLGNRRIGYRKNYSVYLLTPNFF